MIMTLFHKKDLFDPHARTAQETEALSTLLSAGSGSSPNEIYLYKRFDMLLYK